MTDDGVTTYRRFLRGDKNALSELVQQYSDELVRYAMLYVKDEMTAEDVMEDSFASLLYKKRSFKEGSSMKAYLYAVCRNKCIDHLRAKRRKDVPLSNVENVLEADSAEWEFFRGERDKTVYACLKKLPSQYYDVIYLTYFEGFSAEEIHRITGKSKKQIYNLLARAKARLKEIFETEGIHYEDL